MSGSQSGQSSSSTGQYGQAGQSTKQSASGISSSDRQFLTKAAEGSMAEIEMGKLAQERGSSEHVKELGKQLAEDHQKSLDQVRTIAESKGMTLPQEVSKKDKAEHDRLSGMSGDAFDRAFLRATQQDHKKDIAEYKRQAERSTDPDVKQYAQSTLPVLERHEQASMHGTSASSTGATSTSPRTDTEESATAGSKQKDKDKDKDKNKNKEWSEETPKSSSSSSSSSSSTNPK
jgi:putative membrane protein